MDVSCSSLDKDLLCLGVNSLISPVLSSAFRWLLPGFGQEPKHLGDYLFPFSFFALRLQCTTPMHSVTICRKGLASQGRLTLWLRHLRILMYYVILLIAIKSLLKVWLTLSMADFFCHCYIGVRENILRSCNFLELSLFGFIWILSSPIGLGIMYV